MAVALRAAPLQHHAADLRLRRASKSSACRHGFFRTRDTLPMASRNSWSGRNINASVTKSSSNKESAGLRCSVVTRAVLRGAVSEEEQTGENGSVRELLESVRAVMGKGEVEDMISWRRRIHAQPELAFQEHMTSSFVAELLEEWGYTVERGLGSTGVVGSLTVDGPRATQRKAIMLRADMDALPIAEANTFEHRSKKQNAMHACGHDGHTAMLLGAARYLAATRCFEGTVHLVFQPAEEGTPTENEGGRTGGGAAAMLEDGLLEKYPVEAAYGLHNWPGLPVGRLAVHSGPVMAGVDNFVITVEGVGCHAAMPHMGGGSDAVICGAQLVTALQALVSRRVDPQDSAVVSVTQMHAGDAFNVLPPKVVLKGTVRYFSEATGRTLKEGMLQMSRNVTAAYGCTATLEFVDHYPATVNTRMEAATCAAAACALVGKENVDYDSLPASLGAEDFGFILERVPGCYAWIGNGPTDGGCMLHNPKYDFNDNILPLGAAYWVEIVRMKLPPSTA